MNNDDIQRDIDTFGGKLARLRNSLRLTQTAVAAAAEISVGYYSAIENDSRLPPPSGTLDKILIALRCHSTDISDLQTMAACERNLLPLEANLPIEVQRLLIEIRKRGHSLPLDFVKTLRTEIREATN